MQHQESSVDDHIINFEHLKSEGIRGYGFPAVRPVTTIEMLLR